MKVFWAIMALICLACELCSALFDNASLAVIFGVSYLVCYDQMWRGRDV